MELYLRSLCAAVTPRTRLESPRAVAAAAAELYATANTSPGQLNDAGVGAAVGDAAAVGLVVGLGCELGDTLADPVGDGEPDGVGETPAKYLSPVM